MQEQTGKSAGVWQAFSQEAASAVERRVSRSGGRTRTQADSSERRALARGRHRHSGSRDRAR